MSGVILDIKKLFKFKYKSRSDSVSDQYHRLFMTRVMLVGAFLTGMNWFKDDIKCIIPKGFGGSVDAFGPKSCWINGFYVYKELMEVPNFQGYYGLPSDMSHNGTLSGSRDNADGPITCLATEDPNPLAPGCKPMEKLFFLQYQWFPFYMAGIALFYYLPYVLFGFVNTDVNCLKEEIKKADVDIEGIVKNYFNSKSNQNTRMTIRVVMNIVVKILYLLANVLTLTFTDSLLNNQFSNYGSHWMSWSGLDNTEAYNYIGVRHHTKAGERLLPVFGFCDVLEQGLDIKHQLINEYSLVCEISQHVLYHYVLIAVWILIIIGLVVSCLGIVYLIVQHVMRSRFFANEEIAAQRVYGTLSIRESEYLNFIRKKNVIAYGSLIRALHKDRFENEAAPIEPSSPMMVKNSEF